MPIIYLVQVQVELGKQNKARKGNRTLAALLLLILPFPASLYPLSSFVSSLFCHLAFLLPPPPLITATGNVHSHGIATTHLLFGSKPLSCRKIYLDLHQWNHCCKSALTPDGGVGGYDSDAATFCHFPVLPSPSPSCLPFYFTAGIPGKFWCSCPPLLLQSTIYECFVPIHAGGTLIPPAGQSSRIGLSTW